jgi:hypothetical protein
MAKSILASKPEGVEYKLVCIGDKSKGIKMLPLSIIINLENGEK